MPGVSTQTKAVTPTMAADKRLKRADSHRFTVDVAEAQYIECLKRLERTTPHPVVWIRVLRHGDVSG